MDEPSELQFTVSDPVRSSEPLYVRRPADERLFDLLRKRQSCHVLAPPRSGKSSLAIRAMEALQKEGNLTCFLSLDRLGSVLETASWYQALADRVREELSVDSPYECKGPTAWIEFVRDVVATRGQPVVVFFDEVNALVPRDEDDEKRAGEFAEQRLAFLQTFKVHSTERARDDALRRVTFCLLGYATMRELASHGALNPLSAFRAVELGDFPPEAALQFAEALEPKLGSAAKLAAERVMHWTGGHPQMTQQLCDLLTEQPGLLGSSERVVTSAVDALVQRQFLDVETRKHQPLEFARGALEAARTPSGELSGRLVAVVWNIHREGPQRGVGSGDVEELVGSGAVTQSDKRELSLRNRIYESVFNADWAVQKLKKLNRPATNAYVAWHQTANPWRSASMSSLIELAVSADLEPYERQWVTRALARRNEYERTSLLYALGGVLLVILVTFAIMSRGNAGLQDQLEEARGKVDEATKSVEDARLERYQAEQGRAALAADQRARDEREVSMLAVTRALGGACQATTESPLSRCTEWDTSMSRCKACTVGFTAVVSTAGADATLGLCPDMVEGPLEASYSLTAEDERPRGDACAGCTALRFEGRLLLGQADPLVVSWSAGKTVDLLTTHGARAYTLQGTSPTFVQAAGKPMLVSFDLESASLLTSAPCLSCPAAPSANDAAAVESLRLSGVVELRPVNKAKTPNTPIQQSPPSPGPQPAPSAKPSAGGGATGLVPSPSIKPMKVPDLKVGPAGAATAEPKK